MPNLKFDFSRYICAADQSLVRAPPLGGTPSPSGLTYLCKSDRGDIGAPKTVYINIVSIIVLNIEARQYNIKFNLAISCNPSLFFR